MTDLDDFADVDILTDIDDFADVDKFDDVVDLDDFYDFTDFGNLAHLDYFDYFIDFDNFIAVVPQKSKLADQINYADLLLYFADLAYAEATSMSTLADRVNLATLPLNLRIPTNSVPV